MFKNLISLALFGALFFVFPQTLEAHDPQEHEKEQKKEAVSDSTEQAGQTDLIDLHSHDAEGNGQLPGLKEFPNYHPLIVHFPIVFLLVAFLMQVFGFFVKSDTYHKTILVLAALGYAAAYLAAAWRHPHIDVNAVSESVRQIFDQHQLYAKWAVYLGGAGALAKAAELYFKRKTILVILTTLLLAGAATLVSISGHHGAELVHKHGVGTQGRHLEMHEH